MKTKTTMMVLTLTALIIMSACTSSPTGKVVEAETIEIGSILILSGSGASWGTSSMNAIDMAVEDINKAGGINGKTLVVHHEDDNSDAKKAIGAYRKLTDVQGIDIIIGTTWSHTGIPLVEMADSDKTLMVSPSLGKAEFNEGSDFLFNTWPHDSILSANMADYVIAQGHTKVALIGAEQLWVKEQTEAFTSRFVELGGEVVVAVEPLPESTDLRSEALKIKNAEGITALVSTTDGILVGALTAKQVREMGVDLPIYSITIGKEDVKSAQGSYEGMEFLTFLTYTDEFEAKYDEKYGLESMEIGAPSAYDAVMLIAQAMEATDSTDTEVLAEYMNSIETFSGASLTLTSDGTGAFIKDFAVKKVVDGKIIDLKD